MSSYVYIPIIALLFYCFLFFTLLAAKRNRLINSFLIALAAMILWTGGSFCMRMQFWPSVKFWYDISILGLTLLPYTLFLFVNEFIENKDYFFRRFWLLLIIIVNILNISTGIFLKCPEIVTSASGQLGFIYHISWPVFILFSLCIIILGHMFYLIHNYSKTHEMAQQQFAPIIMGLFILFVGHVLFMFPYFKGFPTDILSGVINAFFMFYALYQRRLFKLTLLVSRVNCYVIAAISAALIFANLIQPLERFIDKNFTALAEKSILIIAVCFALATYGIYFLMKKFIDNTFVKEEIIQAENLRNFSMAVSKSLQINEIMDELIQVIQKSIKVKRVYVCINSTDNNDFIIAHSTSLLHKKSLCLKKSNPVIVWLSKHNQCLLMRDFKRTVAFKSMWEEEKKQFSDLGIECFVPLKDEDNLIGIVLLSGKEKNIPFSFDDISFLDSVNSIGSIAVKNSRLYEKAYYEARTDELTGLLNRKYFYRVIQREYEKCKEHSLALIILNIDDFKLYNQLYGTKEGDIALQRVARIIQSSVGDNGYVARYSGKEFAIILPLYDLMAAKNLAENIRQKILSMNKRQTDYSLKVLTVSGGVCSIPHAASNVKQLIDYADMAVFHVKRNGKNAIKAYAIGENISSHNLPDSLKNKENIYSEYAATIYALTAAIDTKDHYTFSHSKNVAYYATELAQALGLNQEYVEIIREAALLHDIGKIGIPEHILNKPGKLMPEEYDIMKGHVENSIGIIRYLPSLDYVIPAVIGHHEYYNGQGYPRRISGEDIPISARILCIADSFDAMISHRSYKPAYSLERALKILEEEAGRQFDPKLVYLFLELIKKRTIKPIIREETLPEFFSKPVN